MIFVVVYNLENRNPPETENKSARNGNARASRACAGAGRAQIKTIRSCVFTEKKPSSELCLKISYRWLLDFCWFFVCTKVSQLLLLFEVVIRSKREYKVVHCVNLTIFFFFWWWLKTFWFFQLQIDCYRWRRRCLTAADCSSDWLFFGKCFFSHILLSIKAR